MTPYKNIRLKKNNFDLLRLLLAGAVCLVHSYELSGFHQLAWISLLFSSALAVKAFFVISGFLIFMSFERSPSIAAYIRKRILRVYPAYFVVIVLCALVFVAISQNNVLNYFTFAWLKYIVVNLFFLNFLQPTLPGVFESNRIAAVNGALWTLKIEVAFYLSVPIFIFLFRRYSHISIILTAYTLSVAYSQILLLLAKFTGSYIYLELGRQLPGQLSYFMAGAFLYYYLPLFERRIGFFLLSSVAVLAFNSIYKLPLLEPFALSIIVVFFGLFFYMGNFGANGDYSYGLYILHFPVIQFLLDTGWFKESPWYFLASVFFVTLTGAIAMWHLVEKWFLFRGNRYIGTTSLP